MERIDGVTRLLSHCEFNDNCNKYSLIQIYKKSIKNEGVQYLIRGMPGLLKIITRNKKTTLLTKFFDNLAQYQIELINNDFYWILSGG